MLIPLNSMFLNYLFSFQIFFIELEKVLSNKVLMRNWVTFTQIDEWQKINTSVQTKVSLGSFDFSFLVFFNSEKKSEISISERMFKAPKREIKIEKIFVFCLLCYVFFVFVCLLCYVFFVFVCMLCYVFFFCLFALLCVFFAKKIYDSQPCATIRFWNQIFFFTFLRQKWLRTKLLKGSFFKNETWLIWILE